MIRPPWSKRQTQQASEEFAALREGVPDGLVRTLIQFLVPHYFVEDEFNRGWIPHGEMHNAFARVTDNYMPPHPEDASAFLAEHRDPPIARVVRFRFPRAFGS